MWLKAVELASMLSTALALGGGLAHLLELPNKMKLSAGDYLTVQQIYRGWALLGIPIFLAIGATIALAVLLRRTKTPFRYALLATGCLIASLAFFFAFTFPVNQATVNWTVLPENWTELRRQWEYSHAVNAFLFLGALLSLTLSFLGLQRRVESRSDLPS
jgi:hypothetical protein